MLQRKLKNFAMKKLVIASICIGLLAPFGMSAAAEAGAVKAGKYANTELNVTPRANKFLADTECTLDYYYQDGQLRAGAYTLAYSNAESISVSVTVKKYDTSSGTWKTFKTFSLTENNANEADAWRFYTTGAGRYKAISVHTVVDGSVRESITNYTDEITVK